MRFLLASVLSELLMSEPVSEMEMKRGKRFLAAEEVKEESDLLLVYHGRKSIEVRPRTRKERMENPHQNRPEWKFKLLEEAKNSCNRQMESSLPVDLHQWYNCVFKGLEAKGVLEHFVYIPWICRDLKSLGGNDRNGVELPCNEIEEAFVEHGGLPRANAIPLGFPSPVNPILSSDPKSSAVQVKSPATQETLNYGIEYCLGEEDDAENNVLIELDGMQQIVDWLSKQVVEHYTCLFSVLGNKKACGDVKYDHKLCTASMGYKQDEMFPWDIKCDTILQAFKDCGGQLEEKVEETVPDEE